MPLGDHCFLNRTVVFDDPIMNDHDLIFAARIGWAFLRRDAVRRPAGCAEPEGSAPAVSENPFKIGSFPGLGADRCVVVGTANARGVIPRYSSLRRPSSRMAERVLRSMYPTIYRHISIPSSLSRRAEARKYGAGDN